MLHAMMADGVALSARPKEGSGKHVPHVDMFQWQRIGDAASLGQWQKVTRFHGQFHGGDKAWNYKQGREQDGVP